MKRTGVKHTALAVLIMLVMSVLAGCGLATQSTSGEPTSADGAGAPARDQMASAPQPAGVPELGGGGEEDRLVIRSKVLRLHVDDTTEAVTAVTDLAKTHSGIVTAMQVATDTDEWLYRYDKYGSPAGDGAALRGWVTVRVPVDGFEAFVEDVSKLGTVTFQSEASDDVTQEHLDLAARLENLRAQESRLRELVAAAKDVTEMLAVEQELWRVRGEIESLDAQVTYLERQAAMATVTVELVEDKPVVRPQGTSWGFVEAITNGLRGAAQVVSFTIAFVIASAPVWLSGIALFFVIRTILRRRKAKA